MNSILIRMIKALLCTLSLMVAGLSASLTFAYGLRFAGGAEGLLIACLFGGADAVKFFLPALASNMADIGRKGTACIVLGCYLFLLAVSASSHVGLVMATKADSIGGNKSQKALFDEAVKERDDLARRLDELGRPRAVTVVNADIAAKKLDERYKRSKDCGDATLPDSRTLCQDIARLEGEAANSVIAEGLRGKLETAEAKVKAQTTAKVFQAADIATESFAALIGATQEKVLLLLGLVIAALIEICSSVLLHVATVKPHRGRDEVEAKPAETASAEPVAPIEDASEKTPVSAEIVAEAPSAEPSPAPTEEASEEPELDRQTVGQAPTEILDPIEWARGRLRVGSGKLSYDDVMAAYIRDAGEQGLGAAGKNGMTRAIAAAGFQIAGKAGRDRHIKNAGLKPARLSLVEGR